MTQNEGGLEKMTRKEADKLVKSGLRVSTGILAGSMAVGVAGALFASIYELSVVARGVAIGFTLTSVLTALQSGTGIYELTNYLSDPARFVSEHYNKQLIDGK